MVKTQAETAARLSLGTVPPRLMMAGQKGTNMNAPRRKKLQAIINSIEELKSQLEDELNDLEEIKDEETECLENLPESLYGSEKYERAEAASSSLEEAYDTLSDLISQLDDVTSSIEEAIDA